MSSSRRAFLSGVASLAACRPSAPLVEPASEAAESIEAHRARLRFVPHRGGRMAYVDQGAGPPVLLVHGAPSSSWMYRHVIDHLAGAGFRVVAPDLLGWGSSLEGYASTQTDAPDQAQALLTLMGSLGLRRWSHVCHDVGGPVTFELMAVAPDAIARLLLLDTFCSPDGWNPPLKLRRADGPVARTLLRGFEDDSTSERWTKVVLRGGLANDTAVRNRALVEGYRRPLAEGACRTLVRFVSSLDGYARAMRRHQEVLAAWGGAAAIVWGGRDRILDARAQVPGFARLLRIDPSSTFVLEDAGHFVAEERPERIAAVAQDLFPRS